MPDVLQAARWPTTGWRRGTDDRATVAGVRGLVCDSAHIGRGGRRSRSSRKRICERRHNATAVRTSALSTLKTSNSYESVASEVHPKDKSRISVGTSEASRIS
jgi:hypothetical protein